VPSRDRPPGPLAAGAADASAPLHAPGRGRLTDLGAELNVCFLIRSRYAVANDVAGVQTAICQVGEGSFS